MELRTGVMTRVFRMCTLQEALNRIARLGFTEAALLGNHEEGKRPVREEMTDADVARVKQLLADAGLTAPMVMAGVFDPERFDRTRVIMERTAEVGAPVLLCAAPRSTVSQGEVVPWLPGERERFAEACARLIEHGKGLGVQLAVKPHGGPTGTAVGLKQLLEEPGLEELGLWYDPGNILHYMGLPPHEDLPAVVARTTGLCLKDHYGVVGESNPCTLGDGKVNWPSVLRTLMESGFAGPAMVEIVAGTTADEVEAELSRGVAYVEEQAMMLE